MNRTTTIGCNFGLVILFTCVLLQPYSRDLIVLSQWKHAKCTQNGEARSSEVLWDNIGKGHPPSCQVIIQCRQVQLVRRRHHLPDSGYLADHHTDSGILHIPIYHSFEGAQSGNGTGRCQVHNAHLIQLLWLVKWLVLCFTKLKYLLHKVCVEIWSICSILCSGHDFVCNDDLYSSVSCLTDLSYIHKGLCTSNSWNQNNGHFVHHKRHWFL